MRVAAIVRALYLPVINLVYPANCHICGTGLSPFSNSPVCPDCLHDICFMEGNTCTLCGLPLPEAVPVGERFLCGECRATKHYFARAISAFIYEGPVRELIHIFKYTGRQYLARFFARAMAATIEMSMELTGDELVIPVPIHRSRLRERGYNQAGDIARCIARLLGLKMQSAALERTTQPGSQVGLTKRQRRENVRGCFRVADRRLFKGRKVFLVDDVYTTGATLDECSRVLLRAGAESIVAVTAARDIIK